MADAMLKIENLNERIKDFGGSEVVLYDAEGQSLPKDQQFTFGNILLNLLTRLKPETPQQIIRARKLGEKIAGAMDGAGECEVSVSEMAMLREAAKQNGPTYTIPVLGYAMLCLGMSETEG